MRVMHQMYRNNAGSVSSPSTQGEGGYWGRRGVTALLILMTCVGCGSAPAPPVVESFYPSSDSLPENLLRVYVQFSVPMKTVGNQEKITLYDADGHEVPDALLGLAHELWSDDQKQWTVLFDPARVKTGLQANEQLGRALVKGHSYRLVIEGMEDVNHRKMEQPFVKTLHITIADTVSPAMDQWTIDAPVAQTKSPVVVTFPQMLDQFSLHQRLIITNQEELVIPGQISIENGEKRWIFTPEKAWEKGEYMLYAHARLADPAGNNLNGLFDHKQGTLQFNNENKIVKKSFWVQ